MRFAENNVHFFTNQNAEYTIQTSLFSLLQKAIQTNIFHLVRSFQFSHQLIYEYHHNTIYHYVELISRKWEGQRN